MYDGGVERHVMQCGRQMCVGTMLLGSLEVRPSMNADGTDGGFQEQKKTEAQERYIARSNRQFVEGQRAYCGR
jgi:hypothetical protein